MIGLCVLCEEVSWYLITSYCKVGPVLTKMYSPHCITSGLASGTSSATWSRKPYTFTNTHGPLRVNKLPLAWPGVGHVSRVDTLLVSQFSGQREQQQTNFFPLTYHIGITLSSGHTAHIGQFL